MIEVAPLDAPLLYDALVQSVAPLDVLELPCEPLPEVSPMTLEALEAEALRANDRYLLDVIEHYAFCPFSREGRKDGLTQRFVHYATTTSVEPLVELMKKSISSGLVVTQVVLPALEIDAESFVNFCVALTDLGHQRMNAAHRRPQVPSTNAMGTDIRDVVDARLRGSFSDDSVFAVAPLHPQLSFGPSAHAMVNLFRRSPDPTIQWVRLDGLNTIYSGRESDVSYVAPEDIHAYVQQHPRGKPRLYDRICETNAQMARRLGVGHVVDLLAEIARDAQRSYGRLILEDA